jgi:hypothetical protein
VWKIGVLCNIRIDIDFIVTERTRVLMVVHKRRMWDAYMTGERNRICEKGIRTRAGPAGAGSR